MARAGDASGNRFLPIRSLWLAILIGLASGAFFAYRLDDERFFMDEAAFLSQAYFGDLFLAGDRDNPLWLEYPAYDLPPLPKYLINVSLRLHRQPRPGRLWAMRWYENPGEARHVTLANLHAARIPSVLMGALGCVAVFAVGVQCGDRRIGALAAFFMAINPLYCLHARRAMADVPTEALVLATAAIGLAVWMSDRRVRMNRLRFAGGAVAVGTLAGLAVLAKLNGGLGLILVTVWAGCALAGTAGLRDKARLAIAMGAVGLTALIVFVGLNPFVTAHPRVDASVPLLEPKPSNQAIVERLAEVVQHRVDVSKAAQEQKIFSPDSLPTLDQKAAVLAIQGFGRFGPFGPRHSDSRRRFDSEQDWGVVLWLPLVLAGAVAWVARGVRQRRRGEPPTAWAIPIGFVICVATVGAFLPLAWDRYLLPIQAFSGLMAAGALVAVFDRLTWPGGRA
jgi:4-amino-4-deoxy-L-arabinose transferase-like glycosyltransferase